MKSRLHSLVVPAWKGGLVVCLVVGLALSVSCTSSAGTEAVDEVDDMAAETLEGHKPPLKILNFVVFVSEEGAFREEIRAEAAYLHQELNIAYLRRVHVDFYKPEGQPKDTLDAPEGYLYLVDMDLTTSHPFFQDIGGDEAITTETFADVLPGPSSGAGGQTGLSQVRIVSRAQKDIDLIGYPSNKIIYRRLADGSEVSCLRAWRNTAQSRLYGVGDCQWIQPRPNSNQATYAWGARVTVDDQMTSGVRIRGARGQPPVIKTQTLEPRPTPTSKIEKTPAPRVRRKTDSTPPRRRLDEMAVPGLSDS